MASPSIHAMAEGASAATEFPSTTAGLQAAIDSLAGAKGKVFIGPGTLEITTVISLHSNCHLQGSGMGVTSIKRASGSLATGDAIYTGNTLLPTAYGSNGTPPSAVAGAISSITISDLTLDGNQSAFGAVTVSNQNHMGIRAFWVDGLRITNVEVKEFLQTGIETNAARDVHISDCRIVNAGQYASASSKNSISFNNTQTTGAIASGYAQKCTITNVVSDSPGDMHIDLISCRGVTVSNLTALNGEAVFELEGESTQTTIVSDIAISNVTAVGNTGAFFTNNVGAGVDVKNITISNCVMDASSSGHNDVTLRFAQSGQTGIISGIKVKGCVFRNCNSSDTASKHFIMLISSATSAGDNISIEDCDFHGLSTSTLTSVRGVAVNMLLKKLRVSGCSFNNVPGVGILIQPGASQITQDVIVENCVFDSTNADAIQLVENQSTDGIIKNAMISGCLSIDANRQTGSRAFLVGAISAAGGGSVSNVTLAGCRAYKNSGGDPSQGVRIEAGAGGTTSNVIVDACDFTSLTTPYSISGTITNCRIRRLAGRGADITAAATISIPADGDVFHVTGNTNITNGITVNGGDNGRTVTLIFEGTPTVSDTGTSKLAGNFVAAGTTNDYDTLTLVCDGTNWTEVARSTN